MYVFLLLFLHATPLLPPPLISFSSSSSRSHDRDVRWGRWLSRKQSIPGTRHYFTKQLCGFLDEEEREEERERTRKGGKGKGLG